MSDCSKHKKELFGQDHWKDIPGFEGLYKISISGDVESFRIKRNPQHVILKPVLANGYKRVCLCKDSKVFYKRIHSLVAQTFIPNQNGYPVINHRDGNKLNNDINNLEWCTSADNIRHAVKTGLISTQYGQYSRMSKLTEEQAIYIFNSNETISALSKQYGVSNSTINAIRKGVNWKHLKGKPDCKGHSKQLFGITDMRVVAEAIGDLHYETLAELIGRLSIKLYLDGLKDRGGHRELLGYALDDASNSMKDAAMKITRAWEICKPFMNKEK